MVIDDHQDHEQVLLEHVLNRELMIYLLILMNQLEMVIILARILDNPIQQYQI